MRKFDTNVQLLKYEVLKLVSKAAFDGTLEQKAADIPKSIIPGKKPNMRCCVYKERAILAERVKLAMNIDVSAPEVIQVIDIACDECPVSGYIVTDSCRGCIAHRCEAVCPKGAIVIGGNHTARIDKSKCAECGLCARVCPYSAIRSQRRPCETACKLHAISRAPDNSAVIDYDQCISCGACVYQCPFGAITDKSYILDAIALLKKNDRQKVYAVVAPAISSQFTYARLGQVVSGLMALGFGKVIEAALGADMVAYEESRELAERRFLTSSCCPAFADLVRKRYPELSGNISSSLSPMAMIAKFTKERCPDAKIVFIGPCTAKKRERGTEKVREYVDCVLTFEELQALFDSREIDITALEDSELDQASYYGRRFARCGGLADAVAQGLNERGADDFEYCPVSCDGIESCMTTLTKASQRTSAVNFIEGMACAGGCVGGAGCLTHSEALARKAVEKYGEASSIKSIADSLKGTRNI